MKRLRVQVYARDPEPGRTKTRLLPALGAEGACRCYLCLLDATLEQVAAARPDEIEVWSDREPRHDALGERAGHAVSGSGLGCSGFQKADSSPTTRRHITSRAKPAKKK